MLRKFFILFALALMPAVAAAQPTKAVTLHPGDSIVVRVAADGTLKAEAPTAAPPMSDFEAAALGQMISTPAADSQIQPPIPLNGGGAERLAIKPGQVRIRLRAVAASPSQPKGGMMLSLENCYDGALRYRAALHSGDRSRPTDVCVVMPHKFGFEHWPYPFDRIEVSDLQIIPWHAGDSVTCE